LGTDFLQEAFGDLIYEILTSSTLDLEIDPSKLGDDTKESELQVRRELLLHWVSQFLDRITSPENTELLPRKIKYVLDRVSQTTLLLLHRWMLTDWW
jgi:hypothetical protein